MVSRRPPNIPRQKLNVEVKTVDTVIGSLAYDSNSAIGSVMKLLNTIPTGNSAITRVGKKVELKAIQIRGMILAQSATLFEKCTTLLIWIRNPNKAATLPAVTEIMVSQSANALSNRDNASRFKIVRRLDTRISGDTQTVASDDTIQLFEEYVPFKAGKYVSCWTQGSVNGTIDEFEQGALVILSLGLNANGATITPLFSGNSRLYYNDI